MKCRITRRGIAVVAVTLLMMVMGILFQDGEFMTIGACGLLMVAGASLLARLNMAGLKLELKLPARFFAMRSVHADLELINRRRWLHARQVEIRMCFVHQVVKYAQAPLTLAGSCSVLREHLSIPGRAEFSDVACEMNSSFPMGLFDSSQRTSVDCATLVYPQAITPPELLWGGIQANHQVGHHLDAGSAMADFSGEPRGIRCYQSGDKMARIHQPASARSVPLGRGLQVGAYDPPGCYSQHCHIMYHSCAKEGQMIRRDRFERSLSTVAGTLTYFQAQGTSVTLQADFNNWTRLPCTVRAEYIECLALLATATRSSHTSERELTRYLQQVSMNEQLIVISDSPTDHWKHLIPTSHPAVMVVNIRKLSFRQLGIPFQLAKTA